MKNLKTLSMIGLLAANFLQAAEDCHTTPRPDAHGPIGLMSDHMHKAGKIMTSYRYMNMRMDGINASDMELMRSGYTVSPDNMTMEMHMFGLMYPATDNLTLMAMANYVEKDMEMQTLGHAHMSGMHGQLHRGHGSTSHGAHSHGTSGWGDCVLSALFRLHEGENLNAHAGLGIGLPTASVEEKMGAMLLPYGMQLGNGVWDLRPSVTVLGTAPRWSWGAQVGGRIALEDENAAGFRYGNEVSASIWTARLLTPFASTSARLAYKQQGELSGHYDGPRRNTSPSLSPNNYGGEILTGLIGINLMAQKGPLAGHRIAIELGIPLEQDLNGIQMEQDLSYTLGWRKAW